MNLTLHDLKLGDIITQLTALQNQGYNEWKVRILYSDGRKSCVGKILAVGSGDDGTIALFPVPEDIENINSVSKLMAMLSCDDAMKGQECGSCPKLPTCEITARIDGSMHAAFDKKDGE